MGDKDWYAFDLDGTLAYYDGWKGVEHIGEPIKEMCDFVRFFLEEGKDVRIFTARLCNKGARKYINRWTKRVFGRRLPVTNRKDRYMVELYDDRAFHVVSNTGRVVRP